MKIKRYSLAAALLAASVSISTTASRGEIQRDASHSISSTAEATSSAQLASLAAELAKTAAKLAEAQQAQNQQASSANQQPVFDLEAANRFGRRAKPKAATSTVRWLGTQIEDATVYEPVPNQPIKAELPAVLSVTSEPTADEDDFTFASDQTLRQLPTAQAAVSKSRVIRAQANEEPEFIADANQDVEAKPLVDENSQTTSDGKAIPSSPADWNGPTALGDSCNDSCCALPCAPNCGCARCCKPRRRIIVAGTDAVFLSPEINGSRVSYVFEDLGAAPPTSTTYGPTVDQAAIDDFYIAPRLWLGVQGECWGVVGRYFHLRAGENAHDRSIPAVRPNPTVFDDGFDANSLLEAYYTDLELTRNFCLNGSKNQFSFGVRYALLEHNESVVGMNEVLTGVVNGGARANRQAYGTGLTFGLSGRKPLFCNSCAHWFYSARSSVLWGSTTNETETWSNAVVLEGTDTALAGAKTGAVTAINDDMFIGEIQFGLEWDFAMRCLPAKSFFRLAFEYQYWDSAVGHAGSGAFSGFEDTGNNDVAIGTSLADAPGLIVDLIGFHIGTGFTW